VATQAQERKRKPTAYNKQKQQNEEEKFLEKQWWLGFKAGANLSKATVEKSYAIVSPTNYAPSMISKQYDNFNLIGGQATLEVSFYFKRFLISFQPTYQNSRFSYANDYEWTSDSEASNRVELHFAQEHKVDHAILPLVIKYDIYGNKLRPYVQIGAYSALLINATFRSGSRQSCQTRFQRGSVPAVRVGSPVRDRKSRPRDGRLKRSLRGGCD
jgi:hypothetical protein